MPAISAIMKRLGFAKLSRYGLALTPEGRIMTLRQDILDDGTGGRIVGWLDRDLAATELAKWEPAKPASVRAVATRVAITPPPIPQVVVPPPPAVVMAPAGEPEEDEWAWEIALARARTAAEETEVALKAAITPSRRMRQDTLPPPPVSAPMRAILDPMDSGDWPKTEPLGAIDYEDYTSPTHEVVRAARLGPRPPIPKAMPKARPPTVVIDEPSRPIAKPTKTEEITAVGDQTTPGIAAVGARFERAKSPSTIIPVPRLPRITGTTGTHAAFEPVVSPRRPPKGTPAPPIAAKPIGVVPPPPIRSGDETRPGILVAAPLPRIPGIKRTAPRG